MSNSSHEVVTIDQKTFTEYLNNILLEQVQSVCFVPSARISVEGLNVVFSCGIDKSRPLKNLQNIQYNNPITSAGKIIEFSYDDKASDSAGLNDALGTLSLENTFRSSVGVKENKIIVESFYQVFLFVKQLQTRNAVNVVKQSFQDVFELGADGNGELKVTKTTPIHLDDGYKAQPTNGSVVVDLSMSRLLEQAEGIGSSFNGTNLGDLEGLSKLVSTRYGRPYAFESFHFNEHGDLLCSITNLG